MQSFFLQVLCLNIYHPIQGSSSTWDRLQYEVYDMNIDVSEEYQDVENK